MAQHDPLADLLYRLDAEGPKPLQRTNARVPVPGRPGEWMEPYTKPAEGRRNQAKVMMLRKLMGIPGEDVGDVSQTDYESAFTDLERYQHGLERAKGEGATLPAHVTGQYSVEAAKARAEATEGTQRRQQERQHTFQAGESALDRGAMAERQQRALSAPVVPTLDPDTGLAEWTPRVGAAGMRTGGSATEREAIQAGAGTLSNIANLLKMGDDIGWQGVGPTGGARNLAYKLLGVGSEAEDNLRVELQKVRSDIMFGSGGKQLTPSEQKVAAGYLTDIYTNPKAARSRLLQVQQLFERAQARRMGRPVPTPGVDNEWEDVPSPR